MFCFSPLSGRGGARPAGASLRAAYYDNIAKILISNRVGCGGGVVSASASDSI